MSRLIAPALLSSLFLLAACDGKPATAPTPPADHAHAGVRSGDGEEKNLATLPPKQVGPVKIGLEVPKTLAPDTDAHLHVAIEGAAVGKFRLWVGVASGQGSVKTAADLSPGEKHLNVEMPHSLAGAKAWVEVESGGKTEQAGFDLP